MVRAIWIDHEKLRFYDLSAVFSHNQRNWGILRSKLYVSASLCTAAVEEAARSILKHTYCSRAGQRMSRFKADLEARTLK